MPPGPQVISGGVNDPAPVPKPSPTHGSYHWTFERLLSVALVPLTIAPFAAGHINAALDAALVFTIILHSHIGFQYVVPYLAHSKHINNEQIMCHRLFLHHQASKATEVLRLGIEYCDVVGSVGFLRVRDERCWSDRSNQEDLACRCKRCRKIQESKAVGAGRRHDGYSVHVEQGRENRNLHFDVSVTSKLSPI
jgi:succinate dehydrogenase hydrophobic anchor subunit